MPTGVPNEPVAIGILSPILSVAFSLSKDLTRGLCMILLLLSVNNAVALMGSSWTAQLLRLRCSRLSKVRGLVVVVVVVVVPPVVEGVVVVTPGPWRVTIACSGGIMPKSRSL